MCITIPVLDGVGFVDAGVGVYETLQQADAQFADHIPKFVLPIQQLSIKSRRYHTVILDTGNSSGDTDVRQAVTYHLLRMT